MVVLADNILKCVFVNENCCILINISQKFFPKDLIDNISALVHIMAVGTNSGLFYWHIYASVQEDIIGSDNDITMTS